MIEERAGFRGYQHRVPGWRAVLDLERRLFDVEEATVERIRRDLHDVYLATVATLMTARRPWVLWQAQSIISEIDRLLLYWESATTRNTAEAMRRAFEIGSEEAVAALKAAKIELYVRPYISDEFLLVSAQTAPVLITAISRETLVRISRALRQAVLAQLTPYQLIELIGGPPPSVKAAPGEDAIKTGPFAGYRPDVPIPRGLVGRGAFVSAFHRSEAIVRTELGRIAQTANHATLGEIARSQPGLGLKKQWSAVIDARTRPDHAAANGQIVDMDKPFIVGGEELMYPHDPNASAAQTVNCRCVVLPWSPLYQSLGA